MISRATIEAASDTLTPTAIASIISTVRVTDRYKQLPAYFSDLEDRLEAVNGTIHARQLNAALDALEALGVGEVQIDQSKTSGTDGVVYSKPVERAALVDYILGVLYEAFSLSIYVVDAKDSIVVKGNYGVGQRPIDYEGYF